MSRSCAVLFVLTQVSCSNFFWYLFANLESTKAQRIFAVKKMSRTEEDLQPSLLSMDKWCKPCLWLSLLARTSIMQCLAQSSLWSSRQLCDASGLDLVPKLRVMMVQNHSHSATPFWDMRFRWQACYHAWSPKTWRTCHDLWPSLSRVARTARASATNRASGWFAWKSLK